MFEKRKITKFEGLIYSNQLEFKPTGVFYDKFNGNFNTYDGEILELSNFVLIDEEGKKYTIFLPIDKDFKVTIGRKYRNIDVPDEIYLDTGSVDEDNHKTLYKASTDILSALIKEGSIRFKQENKKIRFLNSEYFQELEREGLVKKMEDVFISPQDDGIRIPKLGDFRKEQTLIDTKKNSLVVMRHSRLDSGKNYLLALVSEPVPDEGEPVYYQTGAGTIRRIMEDTDPSFDL